MKSDSVHFVNDVLNPVGVEEFFKNYWEQKPLHISRTDPTYYSAVVSIKKIETLLSSHDLYFPNVQLTRSDASLAAQNYVDDTDKILPLRLIQHYHEGATIVISQAQKLINTLDALSRRIHSELKLQCQTNVYLSPPGKKGFNPHFDTHDVLILQISGVKTFNFYADGPHLPLRSRQFDSATDRPGALQQEVTLQAGDTLYIPRGVMHDALADEDMPSLHITVGLFPTTVHELLQEMFRIAAEQDVQFRRSLHVGASHALKLLDNVSTQHLLDEALNNLEDDYALRGVPDCAGLLSRAPATIELQSRQVIAIKIDKILGVQRYPDSIKLRVVGQILEFSDPLASAIESLIEASSMQINDLPHVNDEQKIALCRSLIKEGIAEMHST